MKLITRLTLYITLSKLAIVALFIMILPALVSRIAFEYTNHYLRQQEKKVFEVISKNGVDYYLQGEDSYGSYTLLKEEYISLEPSTTSYSLDTIETSQRVIESDTLVYRVLSRTFSYDNKLYLLEIGKTTATINQYNRPLQRLALYVLSTLIFITLILDLIYTRYLLRPLGAIIRTKLFNRKFPFNDRSEPIKTSITDFRYLDQSLISLMDQVHEAFEKEREFTSNASHELMTPISILQSKVENMMMDPALTEDIQVRLMEMIKTVNRLKKIVNSLLLISRIENDQFETNDKVDIKKLVGEVAEELEHRMEQKNIRLRYDTLPGAILKGANHDLLFQMIYNLLNNAIKYNRQDGLITISGSMNKEGNYILAIEDTGVGMHEKEIPLIFNRFRKSADSGEGSFGLGLAIVKSIALLHGIEIEVRSKKDRGSIFRLSIPGSRES